MQYVLKLTPLGIEEHVFRVVSVDGMADTEHVLNLCNLSFGYANYDTKELMFAKDEAAFKALSVDSVDEDDDHYGPTGHEFDAFWNEEPKLDNLSITTLSIKTGSQDGLRRFDSLIESMSSKLTGKQVDPNLQNTADVIDADGTSGSPASVACKTDTHPGDQSFRFKFIYVLNGVKHLVEVMMSSEKLNCFLPATLMGDGLIVDDKEDRPLSVAMLNAEMKAHEDDESAEDGLNLKECTSRMRALGAMRNAENINSAMLQAGAEPLTFRVD